MNCVFIILADLIGTGIMGLPYTFSKLGWLVGSIILLFFGVLTWYSGFLLWRLHMTYPSGITYGDMAEAVSGKTLKWVAFVIVSRARVCYRSIHSRNRRPIHSQLNPSFTLYVRACL